MFLFYNTDKTGYSTGHLVVLYALPYSWRALGKRLEIETHKDTQTERQRHGPLVTGKKPFIQYHHGGLYTQQSSGPTGENLILLSSRQGTAFSNSNQKALAGKSS